MPANSVGTEKPPRHKNCDGVVWYTGLAVNGTAGAAVEVGEDFVGHVSG